MRPWRESTLRSGQISTEKERGREDSCTSLLTRTTRACGSSCVCVLDLYLQQRVAEPTNQIFEPLDIRVAVFSVAAFLDVFPMHIGMWLHQGCAIPLPPLTRKSARTTRASIEALRVIEATVRLQYVVTAGYQAELKKSFARALRACRSIPDTH